MKEETSERKGETTRSTNVCWSPIIFSLVQTSNSFWTTKAITFLMSYERYCPLCEITDIATFVDGTNTSLVH